MNVALFYEGASGGFYALWHLLLSTDLRCKFGDGNQELRYLEVRGDDWPIHFPDVSDNLPQYILDELTQFGFTLDTVYKRHWDISEKSKWKVNEVWPANDATFRSDIANKLYFYCNPAGADFYKHEHDLKLYVYTDIKTQAILARNKRAWKWFDNDSDDKIIQVMYMDGDMVYAPVCQQSNLADHMIRLRDIVISNGAKLVNLVGGTINDKNYSHNEQWLNLHTQQEKKLLTD